MDAFMANIAVDQELVQLGVSVEQTSLNFQTWLSQQMVVDTDNQITAELREIYESHHTPWWETFIKWLMVGIGALFTIFEMPEVGIPMILAAFGVFNMLTNWLASEWGLPNWAVELILIAVVIAVTAGGCAYAGIEFADMGSPLLKAFITSALSLNFIQESLGTIADGGHDNPEDFPEWTLWVSMAVTIVIGFAQSSDTLISLARSIKNFFADLGEAIEEEGETIAIEAEEAAELAAADPMNENVSSLPVSVPMPLVEEGVFGDALFEECFGSVSEETSGVSATGRGMSAASTESEGSFSEVDSDFSAESSSETNVRSGSPTGVDSTSVPGVGTGTFVGGALSSAGAVAAEEGEGVCASVRGASGSVEGEDSVSETAVRNARFQSDLEQAGESSEDLEGVSAINGRVGVDDVRAAYTDDASSSSVSRSEGASEEESQFQQKLDKISNFLKKLRDVIQNSIRSSINEGLGEEKYVLEGSTRLFNLSTNQQKILYFLQMLARWSNLAAQGLQSVASFEMAMYQEEMASLFKEAAILTGEAIMFREYQEVIGEMAKEQAGFVKEFGQDDADDLQTMADALQAEFRASQLVAGA